MFLLILKLLQVTNKEATLKLLIFSSLKKSSEISKLPSHDFGQEDVFGKSQVSFRIYVKFFIRVVTIPNPIKPPIIRGNSGPKKYSGYNIRNSKA